MARTRRLGSAELIDDDDSVPLWVVVPPHRFRARWMRWRYNRHGDSTPNAFCRMTGVPRYDQDFAEAEELPGARVLEAISELSYGRSFAAAAARDASDQGIEAVNGVIALFNCRVVNPADRPARGLRFLGNFAYDRRA